MSVEETQTKSPTLRGSGSGNSTNNEKPVDLSGAIPFMIDFTKDNATNIIQKQKTKEELEDEWIWEGFISGGTVMTPDYPTKEQQDAEKEVRATLFKDIHSDGWYKPTDTVYNAMLTSPMFQNNDGFTAINDHGLSIKATVDTNQKKEPFDPKMVVIGKEPAENFGIAAANDEADTKVDDFFPEPFIPFTM